MLNDPGVEIGGIDLGLLKQALLFEKDGHGIDLFPAGTSGMPDSDMRIGTKDREHALPERLIEGRIPEHFGDGDGEIHQQVLDKRRIVQYLVDHLRDVIQSRQLKPVEDPAFDVRLGVIAEIISIFLVERFYQQPDLYILVFQYLFLLFFQSY